MSGNGVYWLASYPRSGNTWVRMFLRSYMKGSCDINAAPDVVKSVHNEHAWQAASEVPITQLSASDRMDYHSTAIKNAVYLARDNVRLKTHDANARIHGSETVPSHTTKGGVYLVRDPRDVVCSYADYKGCSIDKAIEDMENVGHTVGVGDSYAWEFLSSWSNHVTSWAGDSRPAGVVPVKYETLLEEPRKTFSIIVNTLGLPYKGKPEILRAVEEASFASLRKKEQRDGFNESKHEGNAFFRKGKAGAWKGILSLGQLKRIEASHGEVMESMGYSMRG